MSFYANSALHALNHTELYQTCRRAGLHVHPRSTREELIKYLMGEDTSPLYDETAHPIDSLRLSLIGFLTEHWSMLAPQLKCPAKKLRDPHDPNPRPCFGCIDAQVMTCLVENPKQQKNILLHRPRRENQ